MADVHSIETRRYNMSKIRSKNTKPELLVRKFLYAKGLRYRLHDKKLPGTPDLVFASRKAVIFVNGCFWHGHEGCRYFVLPKSNSLWWEHKIMSTKRKDLIVINKLIENGWRVLIVWECQLKKAYQHESLLNLLKDLG